MKRTPLKKQKQSNIYGEFLARKERGEQLDYKTLTKRDLYYMNIIERKTHEQIGKLFGLPMNIIRNKMNRAGLTASWNTEMDELAQDIERQIWECLRYSNRNYKDYETYYKILDAIHPEFNERA